MSRLVSFIVFFVFLLGFLPQFQLVSASDCSKVGVTYTPKRFQEDLNEATIVFSGISNGRYQLRSRADTARDVYEPDQSKREIDAFGGTLTQIITSNDNKLTWGTHIATLERWTGSKWEDYCGNISYKVGYERSECGMGFRNNPPQDNEQFAVDVFRAPKGTYRLDMVTGSVGPFGETYQDEIGTVNVDSTGFSVGDSALIIGPLSPQTTTLKLFSDNPTIGRGRFCDATLTIKASGGAAPRDIPSFVPNLPNAGDLNQGGTGATFKCDKDKENCATSAGIPCYNGEGIQTAIGCIHTEIKAFIQDLLSFIAAVAGGIGFLFMIFGAFQMVTSGGNPDNLKAGQERFKDAVIGLLFLLLSILLLQIIGVDILKIPGFNP